ncbi:MAG TPA: hypothetical protein VIK52_09880, partial [Opitutaceae bacterium]
MASGSEAMPAEFALMFPFFWLFGLVLCSVLCIPLKHVSLEGSNLRVSGLKKVAVIPLSDVISVSSSFLFHNPETITLRFRHSTVFGFSIKFTPYHRLFRFKTHPTAKRLKELVASAN